MSKQEALQAIAALPDNVSFDEIIYHLYLLSNISQGQADIRDGRVYTHEQVKEMFQH